MSDKQYIALIERGFAAPIDGSKMEYWKEACICTESTTINDIYEMLKINDNNYTNITIIKVCGDKT